MAMQVARARALPVALQVARALLVATRLARCHYPGPGGL